MADPTSSIKNAMLGLSALEDSLSRVAINRTLADAQSQVNQINAGVVDEREKQVALGQLGQQLALQMAQQGASASMIQETAGGLGPSAGALFQAGEGRATQKASQQFQASESVKDRAHQLALYGTKADAKAEQRKADLSLKLKDSFVKRKDIAVAKAGMDLADLGLETYSQTNGSPAAVSNLKRAFLKLGGEDRLNEGDLGTVKYDASWIREKLKQVGVEYRGTIDPKEGAFWYNAVEQMANAKALKLKQAAEGHVKSRAKHLNAEEDAAALVEDIQLEMGIAGRGSPDKALGEFSQLPPQILRSKQDAIAAALRAPNDPKAKAFLDTVRSRYLKGVK